MSTPHPCPSAPPPIHAPPLPSQTSTDTPANVRAPRPSQPRISFLWAQTIAFRVAPGRVGPSETASFVRSVIYPCPRDEISSYHCSWAVARAQRSTTPVRRSGLELSDVVSWPNPARRAGSVERARDPYRDDPNHLSSLPTPRFNAPLLKPTFSFPTCSTALVTSNLKL